MSAVARGTLWRLLWPWGESRLLWAWGGCGLRASVLLAKGLCARQGDAGRWALGAPRMLRVSLAACCAPMAWASPANLKPCCSVLVSTERRSPCCRNLTLSHGRSYEEAMSELMKARPSSKPLRIAWDRVSPPRPPGASSLPTAARNVQVPWLCMAHKTQMGGRWLLSSTVQWRSAMAVS